jgi:membrane associated rhomboid family serine protease
MERLLARLERRFGRHAIPNLIMYIVGGMAMVWVLSTLRPAFMGRLGLDMRAVRHGEVWRLVTFLFIPPPSKPIWILVNLYFTWWVGSSLEDKWGSFKFNAYYFTGALSTIASSMLAGPTTNMWLDASLFLAFATVFPDVMIALFFILPVRVKWLGILAAVAIAYAAATGDWSVRAPIAAALVNYALFFGEHWYGLWRGRGVVTRQQARRAEIESTAAPSFGQRTCAICGAREADGADIRVCSCEKCGGTQRTLCLEHARNH